MEDRSSTSRFAAFRSRSRTARIASRTPPMAVTSPPIPVTIATSFAGSIVVPGGDMTEAAGDRRVDPVLYARQLGGERTAVCPAVRPPDKLVRLALKQVGQIHQIVDGEPVTAEQSVREMRVGVLDGLGDNVAGERERHTAERQGGQRHEWWGGGGGGRVPPRPVNSSNGSCEVLRIGVDMRARGSIPAGVPCRSCCQYWANASGVVYWPW